MTVFPNEAAAASNDKRTISSQQFRIGNLARKSRNKKRRLIGRRLRLACQAVVMS
jgi:hypothetical protein